MFGFQSGDRGVAYHRERLRITPVGGVGLVLLEPAGQFVSVIEDLLHSARHLGGSANSQVCLDGVTRELREGLALTSGESHRFCPSGCGEAELDLRGVSGFGQRGPPDASRREMVQVVADFGFVVDFVDIVAVDQVATGVVKQVIGTGIVVGVVGGLGGHSVVASFAVS